MSGKVEARPARHSGNGVILAVDRDGDGWRVEFASEPRTSPQPLWFHIEVTGLDGSPVTFVWENADITLGNPLELNLVRPVLRADDNPWRRCGQTQVVVLPDERRQVHFRHEGGSETVVAAFCYPYGPAELDETMNEAGKVWICEPIGVTGEGRVQERLRLAGQEAATLRPGVYLLARQHAGETPGSWALDGILRYLAGDDDDVRAIREEMELWLLPFVDLDGVVKGDYGKDALPWDFNRAWEVLAMRPEVHALQRDLKRFTARTAPCLIIDLHAPTHSTPDIYVPLPREVRPQAQRDAVLSFVEHLAQQFPQLDRPTLQRETRYASRWNALATIGNWSWDHLDQTPCVTVEISYQQLAGQLLTPEGYRDVGRRMLSAVHAWLSERAAN